MEFHDLLGASQYSNKSSEKNKPSFFIVMILQYTMNLWLKFFVQHNDIDNFKVLRLLLLFYKIRIFLKYRNSFIKLCQNQQFFLAELNTKEL